MSWQVVHLEDGNTCGYLGRCVDLLDVLCLLVENTKKTAMGGLIM
jgi:hypothetical protein